MNKTIYLAGGCFWGVQAYMRKLPGILETEVGYANGKTECPSYEEVCKNDTGHAETVKVIYDTEVLSLGVLLKAFFKVVDPTQLNEQGEDKGTQYRNGVYYVDQEDIPAIDEVMDMIKSRCHKEVVTEVKELENFYTAEEYHQNYLEKNPSGYCHINLFDAEEFIRENNL